MTARDDLRRIRQTTARDDLSRIRRPTARDDLWRIQRTTARSDLCDTPRAQLKSVRLQRIARLLLANRNTTRSNSLTTFHCDFSITPLDDFIAFTLDVSLDLGRAPNYMIRYRERAQRQSTTFDYKNGFSVN